MPIALLIIGILMNVFTGLMGLLFILWGVVIGVLGQGPMGPIRDPGTRFLVGDLPLLLGLIYLIPVMALRRASWILAYGAITLLAALILLYVASSIALESSPIWPTAFLFIAPATAWVAHARLQHRPPPSAPRPPVVPRH